MLEEINHEVHWPENAQSIDCLAPKGSFSIQCKVQCTDAARLQMIEQPTHDFFSICDGYVLEYDDGMDEVVFFRQTFFQIVRMIKIGLVGPVSPRVFTGKLDHMGVAIYARDLGAQMSKGNDEAPGTTTEIQRPSGGKILIKVLANIIQNRIDVVFPEREEFFFGGGGELRFQELGHADSRKERLGLHKAVPSTF